MEFKQELGEKKLHMTVWVGLDSFHIVKQLNEGWILAVKKQFNLMGFAHLIEEKCKRKPQGM